MQIENKLNDSNKEEYFRLIDSVSLDVSLDFKIFESKGAGLLASLLTTENNEYIENMQFLKKKKLRKNIDIKGRGV